MATRPQARDYKQPVLVLRGKRPERPGRPERSVG